MDRYHSTKFAVNLIGGFSEMFYTRTMDRTTTDAHLTRVHVVAQSRANKTDNAKAYVRHLLTAYADALDNCFDKSGALDLKKEQFTRNYP